MADFRQNNGRVALNLRTPDGRPWQLTMAAGTEIFIGRYRRIEAFNYGSGLLQYSCVETNSLPHP
jgi:hypothetical protein